MAMEVVSFARPARGLAGTLIRRIAGASHRVLALLPSLSSFAFRSMAEPMPQVHSPIPFIHYVASPEYDRRPAVCHITVSTPISAAAAVSISFSLWFSLSTSLLSPAFYLSLSMVDCYRWVRREVERGGVRG